MHPLIGNNWGHHENVLLMWSKSPITRSKSKSLPVEEINWSCDWWTKDCRPSKINDKKGGLIIESDPERLHDSELLFKTFFFADIEYSSVTFSFLLNQAQTETKTCWASGCQRILFQTQFSDTAVFLLDFRLDKIYLRETKKALLISAQFRYNLKLILRKLL